MERLEERVLLLGAHNTFAIFQGDLATAAEVDNFRIKVRTSIFTPTAAAHVLLSVLAEPTEASALNPRPADATVFSSGTVTIQKQQTDKLGGTASLTVAQFTTGVYRFSMGSELGTTGGYRLEVSMTGDANADFLVWTCCPRCTRPGVECDLEAEGKTRSQPCVDLWCGGVRCATAP